MIECPNCEYTVHPTQLTEEGFPRHTCSGSKVKAREDEILNHWLYRESRDITEKIRREQILKGAEKYPTPLGDGNWTAMQLIHHGLQENIDQNHYLTMLVFKVHEMEKEIERLQVFEQWYKEKPLD